MNIFDRGHCPARPSPPSQWCELASAPSLSATHDVFFLSGVLIRSIQGLSWSQAGVDGHTELSSTPGCPPFCWAADGFFQEMAGHRGTTNTSPWKLTGNLCQQGSKL